MPLGDHDLVVVAYGGQQVHHGVAGAERFAVHGQAGSR
jgi:hypothetical protein